MPEKKSAQSTQNYASNDVLDVSFDEEIDAGILSEPLPNQTKNIGKKDDLLPDFDDGDDILSGFESNQKPVSTATDLLVNDAGDLGKAGGSSFQSNPMDMMMGFDNLDPTIQNPILGNKNTKPPYSQPR